MELPTLRLRHPATGMVAIVNEADRHEEQWRGWLPMASTPAASAAIVESAIPVLSLGELKAQAVELGLTFHPKIGVDKLREKIDAHRKEIGNVAQT